MSEHTDQQPRTENNPADLSARTFAEIMAINNTAGDRIRERLNLDEQGTDLVSLVICTIATLLDDPDATIDEVIMRQYGVETEELFGQWDWS